MTSLLLCCLFFGAEEIDYSLRVSLETPTAVFLFQGVPDISNVDVYYYYYKDDKWQECDTPLNVGELNGSVITGKVKDGEKYEFFIKDQQEISSESIPLTKEQVNSDPPSELIFRRSDDFLARVFANSANLVELGAANNFGHGTNVAGVVNNSCGTGGCGMVSMPTSSATTGFAHAPTIYEFSSGVGCSSCGFQQYAPTLIYNNSYIPWQTGGFTVGGTGVADSWGSIGCTSEQWQFDSGHGNVRFMVVEPAIFQRQGVFGNPATVVGESVPVQGVIQAPGSDSPPPVRDQ